MKVINQYTNIAISMLTGMVRIQATNRFVATPQRTADNLLVIPTPIMEPLMVWVVLTGTPNPCEMPNMVSALAVSAATPSTGVTFVIFVPMVFTIFHPQSMVPIEMAR